MIRLYHARRGSYQRPARLVPVGCIPPSATRDVMTPFQAIRATIYMLLARARERLTDSSHVPADAALERDRAGAIQCSG